MAVSPAKVSLVSAAPAAVLSGDGSVAIAPPELALSSAKVSSMAMTVPCAKTAPPYWVASS